MKQQGDTAELKFMLLNQELGYTVSKPFGDNAKYDLIVDTCMELQRIQVKSTKERKHLRVWIAIIVLFVQVQVLKNNTLLKI